MNMNHQSTPRLHSRKNGSPQESALLAEGRLFLTRSIDALVVYDPDLRYTFINPSGANLLGYPVEEVIGRSNRDLIGDAADSIETHLLRTIKEKTRVFVLHEIHLSDGPRLFDTVYSPVLNDAGEVVRVTGVCRDVTEARSRINITGEQDLKKTEAIETLAGGMAHRFNNALSAVMGNLDLIRLELLDMDIHRTGKSVGRYIEQMEEPLEHMGFITRQLLAYAQGGRYSPTVIPLGTFLQYTIPLLGHALGDSIRIETDISSDLWSVEADTAQLQMVLSAVAQNASEAMENEGTILISAQNVDLPADSPARPRELKPGKHLLIAVRDQGKGMDEATRVRVFEPFFSTKLQGRGLGMAAVYGIVLNHGGWISIESEPSRGTVVYIWLPASEASEKEKGSLSPDKGKAEAATVLVVEDEDPVMEVFRTVLERMGYRVLKAGTGGKAIEIAESYNGEIDLAILDIMLPDIDGRKIYPVLVKARPDLKVIVTSGYSVEGPAREILDAGAQAFLAKPFSLQQLREMISHVLGDAPSLTRRDDR